MFVTLPNELLKGVPSLVLTAVLAFFFFEMGRNGEVFHLIFTLLFIFLLAVTVSVCGHIQKRYKTRIIPLNLVDFSNRYVMGLLIGSITVGMLFFSFWFLAQLIDFIEFLL
jgi:hypothetical protein